MAKTGIPVFSKYKDWRGYETEFIKVIDHDRYDPKTRRHHWILSCKVCGKEFTTYSFRIEGRKSCGCNRHAGRFKPAKDYDTGALLRRAWL